VVDAQRAGAEQRHQRPVAGKCFVDFLHELTQKECDEA
jgi:hypothetical protein